MVCKKPKIRKNPQNFNDFADIFLSEWYAPLDHGPRHGTGMASSQL